MALPSLGEAYSLLADAQGAEFRRRREEERRLEKEARRDQLKYALLQPVVGAAASTGLKVVGDVFAGMFLGDSAKNFTNSEIDVKIKRELASQERAKKGLEDASKLIVTNKADFREKTFNNLRDKIIREQFGVMEYASLSDQSKQKVDTLMTDPDLLKSLDDTINEEGKKITDRLYEMETQFDRKKIAANIKNNPDMYFLQSPARKLVTTVTDKIIGLIPGKLKPNRLRIATMKTLYGVEKYSQLTRSQREHIDFLTATSESRGAFADERTMTLDGKKIADADDSVEGIGAKNYQEYLEIKYSIDNLSTTLYNKIKNENVLSDISNIAKENIAMFDLCDSAREANPANKLAQVCGLKQREYARLRLAQDGVPFKSELVPSLISTFLDDIKNSDLTNLLISSAANSGTVYNENIEKLKEQIKGLSEDEITNTIHNNILPHILTQYRDVIASMFTNEHYSGNAVITLGNLNEKQQENLLGLFLLEKLKTDVQAVGFEEGIELDLIYWQPRLFDEKAEGAKRLAMHSHADTAKDVELMLNLLSTVTNEDHTRKHVPLTAGSTVGPTDNTVKKKVGTVIYTGDPEEKGVKPPDSYEVRVEKAGIFLHSSLDDLYKQEGVTEEKVRDFINNHRERLLRSFLESSIPLSQNQLDSLNVIYDSALEAAELRFSKVDDGPDPDNEGAGNDGSDKLDKEPDPNSMLSTKQAAYKKLYSPGLLQPFGKVIGETVDDIASYRLNNLIGAGWSTDNLKERGYTEEEIQAARDSLLSDPNEKISIDSVFKTAFENQPLNSITVELFTDNPDGMTLPAVESAASLSVADRSNLTSDHDAHGITQVRVSTAIQPGYNTPNIFKVADSLGVPYDEKLAQEAIAITAKGAASQDKMTTEEGPAWQQVVDLLRNPEVNVRLGALYFNNLLEHYDNNIIKAVIAYNAGPVRANSFTGDRSELRQETQDYLTKMGL